MKLDDYVGETLHGYIDGFGTTQKPTEFVLRGVEVSGIWIELEEFTTEHLKALEVPPAEQRPLIFVPYARVRSIFAVADVSPPV